MYSQKCSAENYARGPFQTRLGQILSWGILVTGVPEAQDLSDADTCGCV